MRELVLSDGLARVAIRPDLGAGLAAYDWSDRGVPILRASPADTRDPFDLALNLLVPWSGRISGGGFTADGRFHPLAPNVVGEALPLHGNAFQAPWQLEHAHQASAVLRLHSDGPGPYRYDARIRYELDDGALTASLDVTNRAAFALPFGVGLHPWFPRTPGTTLRAVTQVVWQEDASHLPATSGPTADSPDLDFSRSRLLPGAWINAWFTGWDGSAAIVWPEHGVALGIAASPPLSTCVVYSPRGDADFFCFEPVSHPVDAHNLAGMPGLAVLPPGGAISVSVRFEPRGWSAGSRAQ